MGFYDALVCLLVTVLNIFLVRHSSSSLDFFNKSEVRFYANLIQYFKMWHVTNKINTGRPLRTSKYGQNLH